MKRIILTLIIACFMTGCTLREADVTAVSTKNFNMNSGKLEVGRQVEGEDNVIVIIVPFGRPDIKNAIDKAIEKDHCAVGLSNAVLYSNIYAFLFGYVGYSVKGNLILDKGLPGCG